ncbi:thioredoxin family protein [Ferruginibacter yonginensis]|uniref:Thioredoxin family protein n=1 Tax=Ferruginibacter yonginensis TaxID=1310416 RepID=A0ABV8QUI9_9BACT
MKLLTTVCVAVLLFSFTTWEPDFVKATQTAQQKKQLILLNFSGSDWCVPCIRMHKEIFADAGFLSMADTTLVMVNADFPRSKKHQLPAAVVQQNEMLAEKYNPQGKFPFTVLITPAGKVIKTWDGIPNQNATQFAHTVKTICDGY